MTIVRQIYFLANSKNCEFEPWPYNCVYQTGTHGVFQSELAQMTHINLVCSGHVVLVCLA